MKLLALISLFGMIVLSAHFPTTENRYTESVTMEGYLNWDVNDQSYILSDVESGEIVYLKFLQEERPLNLDEFNFVEVKGDYSKKNNILAVEEMRMN